MVRCWNVLWRVRVKLFCGCRCRVRCMLGPGAGCRPRCGVSATAQGFRGITLRGVLGGPPPPNVDGGHHFRKKCGFAIKTATICARNIRPADACGGAFKFGFIFFDTDTRFFVKTIGTNARF